MRSNGDPGHVVLAVPVLPLHPLGPSQRPLCTKSGAWGQDFVSQAGSNRGSVLEERGAEGTPASVLSLSGCGQLPAV